MRTPVSKRTCSQELPSCPADTQTQTIPSSSASRLPSHVSLLAGAACHPSPTAAGSLTPWRRHSLTGGLAGRLPPHAPVHSHGGLSLTCVLGPRSSWPGLWALGSSQWTCCMLHLAEHWGPSKEQAMALPLRAPQRGSTCCVWYYSKQVKI